MLRRRQSPPGQLGRPSRRQGGEDVGGVVVMEDGPMVRRYGGSGIGDGKGSTHGRKYNFRQAAALLRGGRGSADGAEQWAAAPARGDELVDLRHHLLEPPLGFVGVVAPDDQAVMREGETDRS